MKKTSLLILTAISILSCKKDDANASGPATGITDYHQTAPTQFTTAGETRFAYRILGGKPGIPLLMISSFGSSMDDWDPAITNGLAQKNKVIIFDLQGVGRSSGKTPDNITGMAKDVVAFIKSLGYSKLNVMGFSMGGFITQQLVLNEPGLINKVILTGTGPKGSEGLSNLPNLLAAAAGLSAEESFLKFAFTTSSASISAGKQSYARAQKRMVDRDLPVSAESAAAELNAVLGWAQEYPDALQELKNVTQPVLVAQGKNDIPVPVTNAINMAQSFPNAELIVYADAGHAAFFQYPDEFVASALYFLAK